jgi:hypothetical protein
MSPSLNKPIVTKNTFSMSNILNISRESRGSTSVLSSQTMVVASPTTTLPQRTTQVISTTIPKSTTLVSLPTSIPTTTLAFVRVTPIATPIRNAVAESSNKGPSISFITLGSVIGGVVLLSIIGIYIFRKTTLRKSNAFKNRMKPKTFSFLQKSQDTSAIDVPKMEDYISQPPTAVYHSAQQSQTSHSALGSSQIGFNGQRYAPSDYSLPAYQHSYNQPQYDSYSQHQYQNRP